MNFTIFETSFFSFFYLNNILITSFEEQWYFNNQTTSKKNLNKKYTDHIGTDLRINACCIMTHESVLNKRFGFKTNDFADVGHVCFWIF